MTGRVELLSPAGTLKSLRYALAYGADAVYAGQARYSLRVRQNDFDLQNLSLGIAQAHAAGKKVYVVANIQPRNSKLATFVQDIREVMDLKPDALIMSDPGLMMLLREQYPEAVIHLSVQANAVNWATVRFYEQQGVSRIILSRELSLEEIEEIRQRCPDIELEVFVHGALCMAYSGRCLLSGYINHRDANQGACTNACRWPYRVLPALEDEAGHPVLCSGEGRPGADPQEGPNPLFLLQDPTRPEEILRAFEDQHGTYIFNSRDLRAVALVDRLVRIGVNSLKIEGRTKSFYYVARTAQVYRKAIDDALAGRPFDTSLMTDLDELASRGYTEGFLIRRPHTEYQNYEQGTSVSSAARLCGEITGVTDGAAVVAVRNRFEAGDRLRILTPSGNFEITANSMTDQEHRPVTAAPGDGHTVLLPMEEARTRDLSWGIVTRLL